MSRYQKSIEGSMDTNLEEREVDKDGAVTCGIFLPLPFDLAKEFPDKIADDDSVPHITVLYLGNLTPCDYRDAVNIARRVCRHIAPFEMNLSQYSEFTNAEGQIIPHMAPSCQSASRLARVHAALRRALESRGIGVEHSYGKTKAKGNVPYEVQYKAHATLAYVSLLDGETYHGPKPTGSWMVNELEAWGYEKIHIPLGRNVYNQPLGLQRDPLELHYPMAVRDVVTKDESLDLRREPLLAEETLNELRDSCLGCVRKHLGQAAVLMDEVKQGYPAHRWLAAGHMGEAASEALKDYPKLANEIRDHRVRYMKDEDYVVPIMRLIEKADKANVTEQHCATCDAHKDHIAGGKADKNRPSDFDPKQLAMGIRVEMEHTKNWRLAREIAMDHLNEIPDYYTRLKQMEKGAGVKEDIDQIDATTRRRLIEFVKSRPNLDDSEYHAFAEKLGVSPHEAEEVIYAHVHGKQEDAQLGRRVHPLAIKARDFARADDKAGHAAGADYWRGWAAGSFLTSSGKNPPRSDKSVHPLAFQTRAMSKDDDEEGHKDAAEYWRGWGAGSFLTASGKGKKASTYEESETSLKGYERHPTPSGLGGSQGGIGLAGSLGYLEFLKSREGPELGLTRSKLSMDG